MENLEIGILGYFGITMACIYGTGVLFYFVYKLVIFFGCIFSKGFKTRYLAAKERRKNREEFKALIEQIRDQENIKK